MTFDLERFVTAQDGVYPTALAEISAGHKRSHWMWFVFPQVAGLGSSPTAERYAISGVAEARAYLDHPVLGPRLVECANALLKTTGTASDIFGYPDDLKLRSSMTLFARAAEDSAPFEAEDSAPFQAEDSAPFQAVLERFYDGPDQRTLDLLVSMERPAHLRCTRG